MHVLDLRLDGDDVVVARGVDDVDKRAEERRLPARSRAGDDDQAVGLGAERLQFETQTHFIGRAHVV